MGNEVRLGELANIESGYAFKSSDWTTEGNPVVKIKNVKDGRVTLEDRAYVSDEIAAKASKFLARGGDILLSLTGYVGQVGRVDIGDAVLVNQRVGFVRPTDSDDKSFIYHLLRNLRTEIAELGTGTAQANVAPRDIMDLRVPNFKPSFRRKIGEVLDCFDTKIGLNAKISGTLENIAQTIFKSWFVDFDPVKAKMAGEKPVGIDEATAALFPESMEDSELGLIPKNWNSLPLGDELSVLESGKRPKGGAVLDVGVPSIGAESIRGLGQFDFSSTKYIPSDFYASMPSGKVENCDVLIYKDGAGAGSHVSMFGYGFPFETFAINEHVFRLRAKSVSQFYLYFWMSQIRVKDLMIELSQKSAQPGLNQKDMRLMGFLRPEIAVVERFSELIEPLLVAVMKLASQSVQLAAIRDALLPRLISGELQIPEEMLAS
jgi:type I restriction enzyme S subunit